MMMKEEKKKKEEEEEEDGVLEKLSTVNNYPLLFDL